MEMRSAISRIASSASPSSSNPSCATNRAPRIMRSGSSLKDTSAGPGVRTVRWTRSVSPPKGSWNVRSATWTAIAFMAKSRRTRSSRRLSPKATVGLRVSGW
jgi:hypothetical protein